MSESALGSADELMLLRQRLAQLQQERLDLDRLGSLAGILRGLAHELNNPLAAILGHAQRVERASSDSDSRRRAVVIIGEVERCIQLVDRLRSLARSPIQEEPRPLQLGQALRAAVDRLAVRGLVPPPWRLATGEVSVVAPPDALIRSLEQILDNARRAEASAIVVSVKRHAGRCFVRCDNDGATPSDEALLHAGRPFFTTWQDQGCPGLGLSVARGLLREAGGDIALERRPDGVGARCSLGLPLVELSEPTPLANPILNPVTVLIVDDEPMVAELLADAVADMGGQALIAGTCAAARELARTRKPNLVLLDRNLPDGDGLALVPELLLHRPALRGHLALLSGDAGDAAVTAVSAKYCLPVLAKPFRLRAVSELLASLNRAMPSATSG